MGIKYKSIDEYFEKKTIIHNSGCIMWTGSLDKCGYGNVRTVGFAKLLGISGAHRLAYRYFVGEIPEGVCVLHKCDNPSCVNPDHLMLGSHDENMKDMAHKGRSRESRGTKSPRAKLNDLQVKEILDSKGKIKTGKLSKKYGVCAQTIRNIYTGVTHYV